MPPNSSDAEGPSPGDWGEVERLFHRVADLPPGDQTREIGVLSGANAWLRERLLELARADRGATRESLMHIENATQSLRAEIEATSGSVRQPERIGPYVIKSRIAQGGFGVVYLAEQMHPIRREVALKVVRPGFDIAQVLSRFEAERQALARLTHPNIARILDAGQTEDERPFFAMEYVPGGRITEYCDKRAMTIAERLQLFVAACRAIHHAHQKAIVHRDIKPSNVLVMEADGAPIVKVIDFGIAKVLDASMERGATRQTLGSTVGTPEYMSPEQASSDGGDVDVRSDVYSLGVLLFELVTGLLPHDPETLRSLAPAELYKTIAQGETVAPTRRLRDVGERATALAAARSLVGGRALRDCVKGDLSTIILKATAREQTRRYQDVQTLADDVERYLTLRPIVAREPSIAYRTACFMRRQRTRIVVASLVTLVMLVTTLSVWNTIQTRRETERRAVRDRELAYNLAIDSIAAAGLALEKGDAGTARQRLAAVPMEHRHWEWRVLWGWATRQREFVRVANTGGRMAISRHATRLAVSGSGDTMSVVNTDTGEIVFSIGTGFWTPGMAWHPTKPRTLAVGLAGGIWIGDPDNANAGRVIGPIGMPMALTFNRDGTLLAGLFHRPEGGKAVRVVDAQTGTMVEGYLGAGHMAIAALPDRDVFVWGEVSGNLVAYDMSERREIACISVSGDSVSAIAINPAGDRIAASSMRSIVIVDAKTMTVQTRLITPHSAFDLAFSDDGAVLYSVGDDSVVHAFSATTGDRLQATPTTLTGTHSVAFDARHQRLYVGTLNSGSITALPARLDAAELTPGPSGAKPSAFLAGATVAVQKAVPRKRGWLRDESGLQFIDGTTARTIGSTASDRLLAWTAAVAPHPTDDDLYWLLQQSTVELRRVSDGATLRRLDMAGSDRVHTGAFTDRLLVKRASGGWSMHNVDTGETLVDMSRLSGVHAECLSPDGQVAQCTEQVKAETGLAARVTMRDAMSGELIATLDGRAGSYGVFSPDSRSFVPTGNAVRVYDVRTGKMVRECEGGDVGVWVPVFTPDGSRIICMTSTSMLGVWDVATGRRVAQLPFSGLISMHPDGTLAVIGSDRIVRFVRPSGDVDDPLAAPSGATGDLARQQ